MKQLSKFLGLTLLVFCGMFMLGYYQPQYVRPILTYQTLKNRAIVELTLENSSQIVNLSNSKWKGLIGSILSKKCSPAYKVSGGLVRSATRDFLETQNEPDTASSTTATDMKEFEENTSLSVYTNLSQDSWGLKQKYAIRVETLNNLSTTRVPLPEQNVTKKATFDWSVQTWNLSQGVKYKPLLTSSRKYNPKIDYWKEGYKLSARDEARSPFGSRTFLKNRYSSSAAWHEVLPGSYGKNYRNLDPDLYQLAPEIFDFVPKEFLPKYKNPCWKSSISRMYCLPYFYVMGFPKCGTTDVWDKIIHHPQMAFIRSKEPHFWRDRTASSKSFLNYLRRGDVLVRESATTGETRKVYGDGSATTVFAHYNLVKKFFPDVLDGPPYTNADIIHTLTPGVKLIVMLREPVSRLYSGYLYHEMSKLKSPMLFHREVKTYLQKFQECLTGRIPRACLYRKMPTDGNSFRLKVGLYLPFIQEWLKVFPREQLMVIRLEDWMNHCTTILPEIFKFLDLDDLPSHRIDPICSSATRNNQKEKYQTIGPMHNETKDLLHKFYSPYNKELAKFLQQSELEWGYSDLDY